MYVIILVALIFVILSLANKYLKVPRDNNQRYDGINNRFYGEGYTGDMPVPPAEDDEAEEGQEDQEKDGTEDQQEEWQGEQPEKSGDADKRPESSEASGSAADAPAGNTGFYGNTDDTQGVVMDTEVHIDPPTPQDPGK